MLQPNANPPYDEFVNRIVSYSDQQASVFLQVCRITTPSFSLGYAKRPYVQQKMKSASAADRSKIVTAIANRAFEMMVRVASCVCCHINTQRCITFLYRRIASEIVGDSYATRNSRYN